MMKSFTRYPLPNTRFLWPEGNTRLKVRVVSAVGLLVGSKVLNVNVPFLFKYAIDELSGVGLEHAVLAPAGLLLAYGAARMGASIFQELRNTVFAPVSHAALRQVAANTFSHLHTLDLSFHLTRNTGALSRTIDRGTRGINFLLSAMLFNIVPTILEIGLVSGILVYNFGASYAAVVFGTLGAYTGFSLAITNWRTRFRKDMNIAEDQASNKAVDSLINFETVKYFSNEEHEGRRYGGFLQQFQNASEKTASSLGLLNAGQGIIFSAGLTAIMLLCGADITAGRATIGDLVMVNGLLFQLSIPLNFLGTVYREVKQGATDMENMWSLLQLRSQVAEKPGAPALRLAPTQGGSIQFDGVTFGYSGERDILKSLSFTVPGGTRLGIVGTSGSGKSTILRLLFRFYDPREGRVLIDGTPITDVTLASLRQKIGVVPQDTVLFNDTIFYNIHYGNFKASRDEVLAAAKMAEIHSPIEAMVSS